jgi:hypothetical protein
MHYPLLDNIWQEIRDNGSTIGMHTYTGYADSTHYYEQSLLHDLVGYHIRLWIDHSWQLNPENFCKEGGDPASPYYLLDVINRSEIDYVWSGEKPAHNVFDAFTEPFRLPHRQYYFSGLTRPVWFFGRTRMETWQYHNQNHWIDMQYNLTTQNLDNLIRNRGLCIGYTHFSFWFFANTTPFFYFDEQQNYCLRDSVEALFQTLDEYQTQRGLWIAPVETIFDRMLAIEQVRINRIEPIPGRASYRIFLCNNSEMDLIDLFVTCQGTGYHINHLHPGEEHILEVATQSVSLEDSAPAAYLISYSNRQILISDKSGARLSPFLCEIYNIKGQKVLSQRNPSPQQSVQIDFTGKSAGIYLVKITAQGTKPVLRKLILTK